MVLLKIVLGQQIIVQKFFLNDGTKVNKENEKEMNENLKYLLKRYNNPIDLNRAIKY